MIKNHAQLRRIQCQPPYSIINQILKVANKNYYYITQADTNHQGLEDGFVIFCDARIGQVNHDNESMDAFIKDCEELWKAKKKVTKSDWVLVKINIMKL